MFPQTLKKKKPKDYKIRAFVGFLFLTIIFLVSVAYILYNQKILQKAYFEKIKFNKAEKSLKLFNDDDIEIISGRLGTTLNYDKVHSCLPQDEKDDGSICLEWMQHARLYLNFYQLENVKCYNIKWISLAENVDPTDCYDLQLGNGHWYGGGQTAENAWPLEKGNHGYAPFITGRVDKHEWGNVLKRYFLNTRGAAIVIDDATPLYISVDSGKELCLKAKYDDFAFVNRFTPTSQLNYSICTSPNISSLHSAMTEKLWDGIKQTDINIIHSLLSEPLWEITADKKENFTEGKKKKMNYTEMLHYMLISQLLLRYLRYINSLRDHVRLPVFSKISMIC